jgi:HTH-type transcriptional regulator/antitoxin HigA
MNNFKIIKSIDQYNKYCDQLEQIVAQKRLSSEDEENVELLTLLIEKWDEENSHSNNVHPVDMLKSLMDMHDINAIELSKGTGINKTVLSKILNYKKGFSKEAIRAIADYFKVNQAAFNKPYPLLETEKDSTKKITV